MTVLVESNDATDIATFLADLGQPHMAIQVQAMHHRLEGFVLGLDQDCLRVFKARIDSLEEENLTLRAENRMLLQVEENLTELHNTALREAAHWKNNHATEVRRARVLKERTDLPLERIQAYEYMGQLQAQLLVALEQINRLQDIITDIRADALQNVGSSQTRRSQIATVHVD